MDFELNSISILLQMDTISLFYIYAFCQMLGILGLFLYENRVVSRRGTIGFSTRNTPFLYEKKCVPYNMLIINCL